MRIIENALLQDDRGFLHLRFRGRMLAPFIDPQAIESLAATWDTDENDIFICSHQKVGTHLTKKFVVEILRTLGLSEGHPCASGDIGVDSVPWPEVMVSQKGIEKFENFRNQTAGQPRVWYIHCPIEDLPFRSIHPGTRFIHVYRDPRGAAVSQYFFYKKHPLLQVDPDLDMDTYAQMFVGGDLYFGDYHHHTLGWAQAADPRINPEQLLVMQFENLVQDKLKSVKILSEFLAQGQSLTHDQTVAIARSTEFNTMKQGIQKNPGSFHFDPNTFFRSGKTDDWKELLPDSAVEIIDRKTKMAWGPSGQPEIVQGSANSLLGDSKMIATKTAA
ncbi:MAG: sulfotransferase domain-containing protein [Flavobacteriales bacterium]|nr:sulfotransferase domain-containing protein [Flavobacteriales bacterium]